MVPKKEISRALAPNKVITTSLLYPTESACPTDVWALVWSSPHVGKSEFHCGTADALQHQLKYGTMINVLAL